MIPAFILFVFAVIYRVVLGFMGGGDSWLPNFAPVAAIALCAPCLFPRRAALVLPLAILLASDIILNWHLGAVLITGEMFARYIALLAIAMIGLHLSANRRVGRFVFASAAGSTGFYLITNTASWLTAPEYAKTLGGWVQALTIGVPGYPQTWMFFRNTLVSDMVFTLLFVGCFALDRHLSAKKAGLVQGPATAAGNGFN